MEFKKELNKLVEIVKATYRNQGSKITNEEIATRLGYNRSYFSTLTGASGKVEKEHLENFKAHFQSELAGVIKPSPPGNDLNRERALIKMLFHRVAKLESDRLGIPLEVVMTEMEKDTMIAWKDLEGQG